MKRKTTHNSTYKKLAVQYSAVRQLAEVNQNLFSASTFVVKSATFAKRQNVRL